MTPKRKRAVNAPDELKDPSPSGNHTPEQPAELDEKRSGERGFVGLVLRVCVYFTLGMVAELLLTAWWRLIDEDRHGRAVS